MSKLDPKAYFYTEPTANPPPPLRVLSMQEPLPVTAETLAKGAGEVPEIPKTRSMVIRGANSYPTTVSPETVVLGRSWGRHGDILMAVSGAGMGKSVIGSQAAFAFGIGLPYLGIRPPRPLRILYFSGEDDGVTLGQCREGFLEHSEEITGRQLSAEDLNSLDGMLRTEFSREHVGDGFHAHLDALLTEEPADLVIVNPLLSYVGGEIVAFGSAFLRVGLMPVLQRHQCAALIIHHTPKLSKDSWNTMDDTYSGIGGGEIANIPRAILTLKPTPAAGLFVVTVSKRQTIGWTDGDGKFATSYFAKRSSDPERPAWIPVPYDEAEDMIACNSSSPRASKRKVSIEDVVEIVRVGPQLRQAVLQLLRNWRGCSETTAKNALKEAQYARRVVATEERNPRGGNPIHWIGLPENSNQGAK